MPRVVWKNKEQEDAEWRVVKCYLGEYAGTQLGSNHNDKTIFIDPLTKKQVYLTHRYLRGADGEIFVKSNGKALGVGTFGKVTFGQTENGQMWAIKKSPTTVTLPEKGKVNLLPSLLKESDIAVDLGKAKRPFQGKDGSKCYQIYQFLGTPLDKHLSENALDEEQRFDLAIKIVQAVYHLHVGTYARSKVSYAHLDLKPANICVGDQGQVHLIDYGFSENLTGTLSRLKGTLIFLPQRPVGTSKEVLDVFALLRTLYLPELFRTPKGWVTRADSHKEGVVSLFSYDFAEKNNLTLLLDTYDGRVKDKSIIFILCNLILLRWSLAVDANLKKVLERPREFNENYECLVALGLNSAEYVQSIITNPDSIGRFKQEQSNLLKLNQLGLNQAVYINALLASPNLIDQFEKYQGQFLRLNQLGLNQVTYIQQVLEHPDQFDKDYCYLKCFGLDRSETVKKILDYSDSRLALVEILLEAALDKAIEDCERRRSQKKLTIATFLKSKIAIDPVNIILKNAVHILSHRSGLLKSKSYEVAMPYLLECKNLLNISEKDWGDVLAARYSFGEFHPEHEHRTFKFYEQYMDKHNGRLDGLNLTVQPQ
ncbi:protein kinase domain-containing protein [Piscirickettsia salmonis]|uniref:protein kinase domain-containing protein n=1 Tax=Piscirickettsia salmonis TaxID=1238 RepID=UPI0007C8A291|nr:Serine/threonine-protein kinase PK-1 [Piscirickettsiaceae bacterium NZ-RLO1]